MIQKPGVAACADVSPSQDIADLTQTTKMEESYGNMFSEAESARAVTFKRGHKNATSLQRILQLMRQTNMTAINRWVESYAD